VGVTPAVLVLHDSDLDQVSFNEVASFVMQRDNVPPMRIIKLNLLDFLKFVEAVVSPNRYFLRGV
jgi:hypothetical protein